MATPTPVFPAAIATDTQLKVANNAVQTTLKVNVDAVNTILFVNSTAGFVPNCLVSVDNEIMAISSASASPNPSLTIASGGRGFDGTAAATHAAGAKVQMLIDAWHHNALATEIKAIEGFLGPNGQNLSKTSLFYNAAVYNFAPQSPGGSLIVGSNVITLSPVPKGVNGTNTGYSVYISGGSGSPEAAAVTGGTAVSGAASGTLIVTCANPHSGAWTVASATGGIQEAICDMPANGGVCIVPSDITLRANVVKAGKAQPSVWKLSGVSVTGSFSVLEQAANANLPEWVTGPHAISALLGTFNNCVCGLAVFPEAHDPFPPSYGVGIAVGQSDPTKITPNQFFHGVSVDMHTSNPGPNQNAAMLGFMYSHGGSDPFGGDLHAIVPSTATAVPAYTVGVQAETQVDITAAPTVVWPLLVNHNSAAPTIKKATAMIQVQSPNSAGALQLMATDNSVFTDEGILLRCANTTTPLMRAFAVINSAGTKDLFKVQKNGAAYFDSSAIAQNYNFVANETGANNAIAGTFTNMPAPTIVTGMEVVIKLAHSLAANAVNTFNLAGTGAVPIRSHFNSANNIATGYPAGGVIKLCFDGTVWVDMSQ